MTRLGTHYARIGFDAHMSLARRLKDRADRALSVVLGVPVSTGISDGDRWCVDLVYELEYGPKQRGYPEHGCARLAKIGQHDTMADLLRAARRVVTDDPKYGPRTMRRVVTRYHADQLAHSQWLEKMAAAGMPGGSRPYVPPQSC